MLEYVMRMEGVNFTSTVTDTTDLSIVRGGSLALLWSPIRMCAIIEAHLRRQIKPLYMGASQAAFHISCDAETADRLDHALRRALLLEGAEPDALKAAIKKTGQNEDAAKKKDSLPLAHLRFVLDRVPLKGSGQEAVAEALAAAEAHNRARQMRSLTVVLPFPGTARELPDPVSRILPGETTIDMPRGSITPLPGEDEEERKSDPAVVSKSVAARRHFGRQLRQGFYRWELNEDFGGLRFTDSLQDIASEAPHCLPEQVRNKIAVFYADGNKFGKIREQMAGSGNLVPWPPALCEFSRQLGNLRKNSLLRPLLTALRTQWQNDDPEIRKRAAFPKELRGRLQHALRFETLLWGGDEILFVAPAWLGFWLVEGFFTLTNGWPAKHEGELYPLTHAAGLVICDRKTPIRQSKAMAEDLANRAKRVRNEKGDLVDAIQIEVFESADVPEDQLDRHRCRLYPGLRSGLVAEDDRSAAFTLPGALFRTEAGGRAPLIQRFAEWQNSRLRRGLPRSQVYRLLHMATAQTAFVAGAPEQPVRDALLAYRSNAGRERDITDADTNLWADPKYTLKPDLPRPLALSLAMIAQYWDFAAPFAQESEDLPHWQPPNAETTP